MSITARELNRATLGRQLLLRREPLDVAGAVRRIVALQAQSAASPYLALWNRLAGFDPAGLDAADANRLPPERADESVRWLVRRYLEGFDPALVQDVAQFTLLRRPVGGAGGGGWGAGGVPGRPRTHGLPPLHPLWDKLPGGMVRVLPG